MTFSFLYLVAAFGGGILGAALGGLPVFILCGVAAIVGAGITAATGDATFSNLVAWGPLLGPQVSFAGAAAAAAYAAKKGKLANGKDICSALMGLNAPDVLVVGGLFGMLGYVLQWLISMLPMIGSLPFTNAIALSIVLNAIIARLLFGKTGVFGKVRAGDNRWVASDVAAWLPWQNTPLQLLTIGLGFGLVVAWTTVQSPAMAGLWFGVATLGLVFLQFNVKVPVWHHIALSAEQVIAVAGGDMWWAVAFAIMSAFIGDFYGQLFLAHGDNHIDPPSASLFTTFIIMAIFKAVGLFEISGVGSVVAIVVIAAICYAICSVLKSTKKVAQAKAQA